MGSVRPRRVRVEGDLYHGRVPAGAAYIGRACPGLKGSPFRNPFAVKTHGRAEALRLFRGHLAEHPELVERARRELAGLDLACWCRPGEECHGDVWLAVLAELAPYSAAAGSGTMGLMALVTLGEWAAKVGRAETAVRNHLAAAPGFPAPKGTRPRTGKGTPYEEYDEAELDEFLKAWEAAHAPARYQVPGDPDEMRTLGAIAKLLGVDGKSVTQYRAAIDEHAAHEDRGARRYYRTGDVVEVLNSRKGFGVALDPTRDRRRTATASEPGS
ncbi:DUF4326 domain-containing protein [Nonomuraea rhodomycinica]|nr:DUF4326 domain-containing protein [Nonomuraea rhodomycinica]